MISTNQTELQRKIEYNVTNGLGFNPILKLPEENSNYKDWFSKKDLDFFLENFNNKQETLQAHLFDMNMDYYIRDIFEKHKVKEKRPNLFTKIRISYDSFKLSFKRDALIRKIFDKSIEDMGGIYAIYMRKKCSDMIYLLSR